MMGSMKFLPTAPDDAVCTQTLGKLCAELGPESVNEFIGQFNALLPLRITRLDRASRLHDRGAGEDAALSLKSAATMAGALGLAGLAFQLHEAFREGQGAMQRELIGRIEMAGSAILAVLDEPGFAERALRAYRASASA